MLEREGELLKRMVALETAKTEFLDRRNNLNLNASEITLTIGGCQCTPGS